jgi:ABC-2 type transport system ATP-binding protein
LLSWVPNAAGKTTTIRILVGLMKPTAGQGAVKVAGFDVQTEPLEARRRLAYVPDFPFLYDKLTPWEFFGSPGRCFHVDNRQIERAVRRGPRGSSRTSICNIADREPLARDPSTRSARICDDARTGGDCARRADGRVGSASCAGAEGHSEGAIASEARRSFVSTHQLSVAEEMADRIGIMHHGRLIAAGSREALRVQSGRDGALEQSYLALTLQEADFLAEAKGGGKGRL